MKLALLSGGSRGLGAALADEYQTRGFRVIEYSRSAPHAWSVACDFRDPPAVETALIRSLAPYRGTAVDELVLISNAATLDPIGFAGTRGGAEVSASLAVSFTSAIVFVNTALRLFADHAGRKTVASISSGAALKPYAGWSLYCAAKAGLEHFVRTAALEQRTARHPFRIVSVDPGVMDTAMQAMIRDSDPGDFPAHARFVARWEAGELKAPRAVASAIVALLDGDLEPGERYSALPPSP